MAGVVEICSKKKLGPVAPSSVRLIKRGKFAFWVRVSAPVIVSPALLTAVNPRAGSAPRAVTAAGAVMALVPPLLMGTTGSSADRIRLPASSVATPLAAPRALIISITSSIKSLIWARATEGSSVPASTLVVTNPTEGQAIGSSLSGGPPSSSPHIRIDRRTIRFVKPYLQSHHTMAAVFVQSQTV